MRRHQRIKVIAVLQGFLELWIAEDASFNPAKFALNRNSQIKAI
jgi:hypothetical protein